MKLNKLIMTLALTAFSAVAYAVPTVVSSDTCGEPDRVATLTGASMCAYDGVGNLKVGDINAIYPSTAWSSAGEIAGADGDTSSLTDGYLTVESFIGWGEIPNNGTWAIDADFWTMYDEAVISMHVGGGGNSPDAWAWLITPDIISGEWDLDLLTESNGGGLSNMKLWGRGDGHTVPEPGIVALLAMGLLGMVAARRKMKV